MRKCTNCNADIPDGEFFCPVCLEPIQLVPDYETIESRTQENELRKKEEEERLLAEEQMSREHAMERRRIRKQRTMLAVFALIAIVLLVIVIIVVRQRKQEGSFEYQYRLAMDAYRQENWADALAYTNAALEIQPDNQDAGLLLGMIYEASGDVDQAVSAYENVIRIHPDFTRAYDALVPLYTKEEQYEALQTMLEACPEEIRTRFADYLAGAVVFSLESGIYHEEKELSLDSDGKGTIYYTIDGTEPSTGSLQYRSALRLKEGETKIRAKYISPKGVPGPTAQGSFTIQTEKPKAPVITPRSGTYTSLEPVKITVEVPAGYKACYSFDSRPTKNSTRYTEPVTMPEGDHIFYAVLVDDNGKEGDVASATYIYKKTSRVPTPTPRQQNPRSVIRPDATVTPEPTPEPEPELTAEPSPTASPTAEPTSEPTQPPTPEPTQTPAPEPEVTETPSPSEEPESPEEE